VTFEECDGSPEGHLVEDGEDVCERCEGERCPLCLAWFRDYDALQRHAFGPDDQ
jgi:hypothetical protein